MPTTDGRDSSKHVESRRLAAVQPPVIPIVGRWTSQTPGTISLGQGVVSYGPPAGVLDAVRRVGDSLDHHRYGPVEGLPALVEGLQTKLARENGIAVSPASRIVVTAGGNMAFVNAILAITDPGDEVILPLPYYFNHEMAIVIADAVPVGVATRPDYQLDVEAMAAAVTPRTRAIVTVSPNNPTGVVYPEAALRAVNEICRRRGIFHIHDEAYEYFTYGTAAHFSPGSIPDAAGHTISLFSFSKAFGMASWRVGYMVIPEQLWDAVNKIQDTVLICPPAVSQHAALAALAEGRAYARGYLDGLNAMRQAIFDALTQGEAPCDLPAVEGAFYYLLRVHSSLDSMTLVERLIREHRVAAIPGSAFADPARCSVRISYGALDAATVAEGVGRLVRGLRALTA